MTSASPSFSASRPRWPTSWNVRRRGIRFYLSTIARIAEEAGLPPFDRSALAWLVDLGSHLCEDQRRLSLKFPLLREQMIEAAALARMEGKDKGERRDP